MLRDCRHLTPAKARLRRNPGSPRVTSRYVPAQTQTPQAITHDPPLLQRAFGFLFFAEFAKKDGRVFRRGREMGWIACVWRGVCRRRRRALVVVTRRRRMSMTRRRRCVAAASAMALSRRLRSRGCHTTNGYSRSLLYPPVSGSYPNAHSRANASAHTCTRSDDRYTSSRLTGCVQDTHI